MEEIWKPILGYEGYYEISNTGRVKCLPRKGSGCKNYVYFKKITPPKDNVHYPTFSLNVGGKSKSLMLHRVLAIHFIQNPENKLQVNHIDGNKSNNDLSNLEWVSPSENIYHGLSLGIMNTAKGVDKPHARFTENDVRNIKTRLINGDIGSHIAKDYGVHKGLIYYIKNGRTWKHITV
jgi:hypothetical protein